MVLVADGQVTMGGTVVKPNVRKTRKIGEHCVGGFAGATADALTLFERLETKLEVRHPLLRRKEGRGRLRGRLGGPAKAVVGLPSPLPLPIGSTDQPRALPWPACLALLRRRSTLGS